MLGRETKCGLEEKRLNVSEGQSFVLPPNMRQAFNNTDLEEAEYHVSMVCKQIYIFNTSTTWKYVKKTGLPHERLDLFGRHQDFCQLLICFLPKTFREKIFRGVYTSL